MFAVFLVGFLQGVERPRSVYSTMPQWCHLTVIQYVAASFHLPSISTANSNTVQYTKPYQQCEIPTIPAVVISEVRLPHPNFMAAFVRSHINLFSDVSSRLQTQKSLCHTICSSIHYGHFLMHYQKASVSLIIF